jgi:hypothetical protein
MKKSILTLALIVSVNLAAFSQTHWAGPFSGTTGTNNSFFGSYSGNAALAASADNAYVGFSSGRLTTSGIRNSALGSQALYSNTTGSASTAIGYKALYTNTAHYNTAVGGFSLQANTTGTNNTASGYVSLYSNTVGTDNSAFGQGALYNNSNGNYNTAIGKGSLETNSVGDENTAIGYKALFTNYAGDQGVAIGYGALYSDTYGGSVAVGYKALYYANTAIVGRNVAIGHYALFNTTTAGKNVGVGNGVLYNNMLGGSNTAMGDNALVANTSGSSNSAFGQGALNINTTGSSNSAFGAAAGPQVANLSNTTTLGLAAYAHTSNYVRVGNAFVTNIEGYANFVNISDVRFKKEIKEEIPGLSFVTQLRPVSYILDRPAIARFSGMPDSLIQRHTYSPERQTGFIAQEVEEIIKKGSFVFDGVRVPQHEKENYGIRYSQFVVPLVKAVQELNAKVEEQQKTINALLIKDDSSSRTESNSQGAILYDTSPNPFLNDTEIKMKLPETAHQANLIVYNLEGHQLKSFLVNSRGETSIKISSHDLPGAGMYLYALIVDGKVIDTKRMILTK